MLHRSSAETFERGFEADFVSGRFGVISITPTVLRRAAGLTSTHGLRAYDAVQLASALAARDVATGIDTFACFDRALVAAAVREDFAILGARPPE